MPPDGAGMLVLITGNAGSGKDTVMAELKRTWPDAAGPLYLPQRFITRKGHPSEPFVSVDAKEFSRMEAKGDFWITWASHGLSYGIAKQVVSVLAAGQTVVINVSRDVVAALRRSHPNTWVVFLSVPLSVTRKRVTQRGREAEDSRGYESRIRRAALLQSATDADITIENTGKISDAAGCLQSAMLELGRWNKE